MDNEYLIKKWLKDELTDVEKEAFEKLDDYKFNTTIIDAAKQFKASEFSNVEDFQTFKKRYESYKKPVKKLHWLRPAIQIAAALVIGFGIYFYTFNNELTTFETLASQKLNIELPDHSQVKLNAGSLLEFDDNTWLEDRQVNLKGEAYFIVENGSKFNVITSEGIVTVVGTEFNVKQRENYFEVKCFEGTVKVTSNHKNSTLNAGDTFQILNGIFIEKKTILQEPQWINGISNFTEVPFKVVIAEFERQYNINVSVNNVNTARKFTGGFNHDNFKEALISITKPMGLTYEVSLSNEVVIIHENKE